MKTGKTSESLLSFTPQVPTLTGHRIIIWGGKEPDLGLSDTAMGEDEIADRTQKFKQKSTYPAGSKSRGPGSRFPNQSLEDPSLEKRIISSKSLSILTYTVPNTKALPYKPPTNKRNTPHQEFLTSVLVSYASHQSRIPR